jgi:hypothetical protein
MFHHMALGEPVGFCARVSQNNYSTFSTGGTLGYAYNTAPTFVHIALMGDPSLRLHAVKPATSLIAAATSDNLRVNLSWQASPDADYYVVLRSGIHNGQYKIISDHLPPTQLTYTDSLPNKGMNHYQVRAVRFELTPSGTYYNLSLAISDSASSINTSGVGSPLKNVLQAEIYPNPSSGVFFIGLKNQQMDVQVECYDMNGRKLFVTNTQNGACRIDSGLTPGIYFIRLINGEEILVRKVIIQQ